MGLFQTLNYNITSDYDYRLLILANIRIKEINTGSEKTQIV
jgi:hypothetical protein